MIIELVGPPASGKSTYARTILKEIGFERLLIRTKKELLYLNIMFILKYPVFSLYTLWLIISNSSSFTLFYYKFMNTFLHHNARYEKASNIKYGVIDEGFTQNILSIFDRQISLEQIIKYLRKSPKIDVLFLFDVPKKTIEENSNKRGFLARETFYNKEEQEKWLLNTLLNMSTLKKALQKEKVTFYSINEDNWEKIINTVKNDFKLIA